jgi:multiple sugar transport system permease protein
MSEELTNIPKLPTLSLFRNMTAAKRREMLLSLMFISPWLFGFTVFTFFPTFFTLLFSFMDLKGNASIAQALATPKFIGFNNYIHYVSDPQVIASLWITVRFAMIALPVGIGFPLALALLMNSKYLPAKDIFRSLFYMPYIVPFIAAVFLWGGMLNPESGWINRALLFLGAPKASLPQWVNDANTVYPAYVIMGLWGVGQTMLIMLAGLQGVPTELYDAANMDGANTWQQFWNVTFPMISPVIFFNLVLSIVGLFQYFLVPLVLNNGSGAPAGSTLFYNVYLYLTIFRFQDMSYGSTLAWGLFIIILLVTVVLFSTSKYWVYYAGDGRN